jgi:hypothetical protein
MAIAFTMSSIIFKSFTLSGKIRNYVTNISRITSRSAKDQITYYVKPLKLYHLKHMDT